VARPAWHLRHVRPLIYAACAAVLVAVPIGCALDAPDLPRALIGSRQLYGLWALSLLLVAMVSGPVQRGLPRLARQAVLDPGQARGRDLVLRARLRTRALVLRADRVARRSRRTVRPGRPLDAGARSRSGGPGHARRAELDQHRPPADPRRPTALEALARVGLLALPLLFIHAKLVGTDFGAHLAPDVKTEPDAGALLGLSGFAAAWLVLFVLRRRGWRWS
jgi:hypothetical protein